MPFASFNPINPRNNSWNFHKKNIENWQFWKKHFFWVGHFEFCFSKKKKKCFIPMKISHKLCVRVDGSQFLWLWWFTAKTHSPQTYQPAVYVPIHQNPVSCDQFDFCLGIDNGVLHSGMLLYLHLRDSKIQGSPLSTNSLSTIPEVVQFINRTKSANSPK